MTRTECRRCRLMPWVTAFITGLVFGTGLAVSGMTQPARVIAFLNPLRDWDPSLGLVMAGAAGVYAIAYRTIVRHGRDPWFDLRFHLPTRRDLDVQLIAGAALFGIGWGLAGLCPGPGIVAAASGSAGAILFVAAMLAGMFLRNHR